MCTQGQQEEKKIAVVPPSYAIVDPWAVMVKILVKKGRDREQYPNGERKYIVLEINLNHHHVILYQAVSCSAVLQHAALSS